MPWHMTREDSRVTIESSTSGKPDNDSDGLTVIKILRLSRVGLMQNHGHEHSSENGDDNGHDSSS
jgi:hypothetical protein